ncbi:MAG: enoyl-CoA hydratase/isomerase family protein [Blastocatellia bacterium]|nr:enoyl-CoA hydratase/isomerase family protein [Blastocatellia bacterium]
MADSRILNLYVNDKGVATIVIDLPGERYNLLKRQAVEELAELITIFEQDERIVALVIISGKEDNFLSGADISMFADLTSVEAGYKGSLEAQKLFSRLYNSKKPVVIAINGICVGGGLELALNGHYRIATDHPKTALGLPEVKLGLLPGATGTQRLSRLVPIEMALEKMLTGKNTFPARAKFVGLIDEICPPAILREVAEDRAYKLAEDSLKVARPTWPVPKGEALEAIFKGAEAMVNKQTKGLYPAPYKILKAVKEGLINGIEAGFEAEARGFGELVVSREALSLIHIFFRSTEAKKDSSVGDDIKPMDVEKIAVLGAGLMGAGVAAVSADTNYVVRMKDRDEESVGRGISYAASVLKEKYGKRRNSQTEISKRFGLISGATDYSGFKTSDLVIEAVFEDVALKHKVIKEVEEVLPEHAIFASNTSAIPITMLVQASKRPERFIGMHFFSPVHKMPLVEIIVTEKTAPEVTATVVDVTRRYGKTPIVVNDGPGFYTSRVFGRYVLEGYCALAEGYKIEDVDAGATKVGFPVGPITVTDEVGIDVAEKAGKFMAFALGERMKGPDFISKVVADGRMGRKNGRGFYLYNDGKKGKVDSSVYNLLPFGSDRKSGEIGEFSERFLYAFLNEAAYCLQENILRNARDGDVGGVMGIGFPPILGGPFKFADTEGLKTVVDTLAKLESKFGERFKAADILLEMAKTGKTFF